jgi:hypothetical protein
MTLAQGVELGQLAKAKGYVLVANKGKVQFQTGHYDEKGNWVVDRKITTWIADYNEAKELICES